MKLGRIPVYLDPRQNNSLNYLLKIEALNINLLTSCCLQYFIYNNDKTKDPSVNVEC